MKGEPADFGATHCIACGSPRLYHEWSIVSPFFAARALQRQPGVVDLAGCRDCGTRHFTLPLDEPDLARLYAGYRGEEYFRQRNGFEPWYTRALNDGLGSEGGIAARRRALASALAAAGIGTRFGSVLDFGGDRGQMLRDLDAARKATYEISGVVADPGVDSATLAQVRDTAWDLILCCHVLEHWIHPAQCARQLHALGHPGTVYFFEVPHETVPGGWFNRTALQRLWLTWICRRPRLLQRIDFISSGMHYRLKRILPLLFMPLREHLTFFSVRGIAAMLERCGYDVISAGVLETGHTGVIARKRPGTGPAR